MPQIAGWLNNFLHSTAWRFDKVPPLYGWFHIVGLLIMIIGAVGFYYLGKKYYLKIGRCLIFVVGLTVFIYGLYRQFFMSYVISNGKFYNYNFFPFQISSIFVYLCLLSPILKGKARETVLDFICTFSFIGGLGVMLYPDTTFSAYVTLSIYGMFWHSAMVWIAAFCFASRDLPDKKRLKNLFIMLTVLVIAAQIINIVGYKCFFVHQNIQGYNCFFISPYVLSKNVVLEWLRLNIGGFGLTVLYILVYYTGAYLLVLIEKLIKKKQLKNCG